MEIKKALKIRRKLKSRKPKFQRQEGFKHSKLKDSWRRPKGKHSKLRQHEKVRGAHPSPGYGSPGSVRGLTRSGLKEIRVSNPDQLSKLDSKTDAAMISGTVGKLKRKAIIEGAKKQGIKVLNP